MTVCKPQVLYKGVVHPWLCDVMGHMNVRHYISMFDDAGFQLLSEATGWNPESEEWQGKGWADVSHQVDYQGELRAGALIEIEGGITAIGNSSFTAQYQMKNKITRDIAATLVAKIVFFDLVERRSIPLTLDMRTLIEGYQI